MARSRIQRPGMASVSYAGWQVAIKTNSAHTKARIESIDDTKVRADLQTFVDPTHTRAAPACEDHGGDGS